MRSVNVHEATERELDWLVAKCEGLNPNTDPEARRSYVGYPGFAEANGFGYAIKNYSTSYMHGSPIIDRELIVTAEHREVGKTEGGVEFDRIVGWKAHVAGRCYWSTVKVFYGRTHLIAAMRAYVASKLGEEVEVPDELFR